MDKAAEMSDLAREGLRGAAVAVPFLLLSTLLNAGSDVVERRLYEARKKKKEPKAWEKLLQHYPDLAEDYQKNKSLFETIHDLYPSIAAHPEAIVSVIRLAKDYSTGGLDPSTLLSLAKTEAEITKKSPKPTAIDQAKGLSTLIESIDKSVQQSSSMPRLTYSPWITG